MELKISELLELLEPLIFPCLTLTFCFFQFIPGYFLLFLQSKKCKKQSGPIFKTWKVSFPIIIFLNLIDFFRYLMCICLFNLAIEPYDKVQHNT